MATWAATMVDGVAYGLLLFTVSAGLALIFGVMDVLNLAHGTFYLAGAYLAWALGDGVAAFSAVAGLVALGVAALAVGAAGGGLLALALRPLRAGADHLDQALATLGLAFIASWAFTEAFGAAPLPASPPAALAGNVVIAGHGYPVYRLLFIVVAAFLAACLHLVVRSTHAGTLLRATVSDPAMAAASGIRVNRVRVTALAVGGAITTLAGVLGAPLLGPAPGVDVQVLVLSLVVVVVGGAGSVVHTLAAALLVGQVQTVGVIAAPTLAAFLLFGMVLAVLVIRGRTGAAAVLRA
ncbi:branched-chain amino acid ABC transporter permease [Actinoplanes sp. NEAU-A12]|uniref:Branched-chain amino acid ABC transporter permease n=1 Tax=Actinoplanes sandaracinus TaxID=3045177 RepID=A0ABT6WM41_9ACTN|nr:branched-chain amino acid ABC transporter permease [Actinoplanes sandaracinus]MDI6100811.1 branched-chain amino acid ABC transporter permease [Actinoplanes sandaracinus]